MAQLVAHLVRDQEVARSSRVTQTEIATAICGGYFCVWVTVYFSIRKRYSLFAPLSFSHSRVQEKEAITFFR